MKVDETAHWDVSCVRTDWISSLPRENLRVDDVGLDLSLGVLPTVFE